MTAQKSTVFVYGTLKRGQCRSNVLADQEFLGVAFTAPVYVLVELDGYPGLVLPDAFSNDTIQGRSIGGELYRVDTACLSQLDAIECIDEGLYSRQPVQLIDRTATAVAYFYEQAVKVDWIIDRWD